VTAIFVITTDFLTYVSRLELLSNGGESEDK